MKHLINPRFSEHKLTRLYLYTTLLCLAAQAPSWGQAAFNDRHYFGYAAAVFNGIHVTDSCIYTTGLIADTLPPFYPSALFWAKYSLEGEMQAFTPTVSSDRTIENWRARLLPHQDGFLTAGRVKDSTGLKAALLFLGHEGHLASMSELETMFPPHQYSFIAPESPVIGVDGKILLSTTERNPAGQLNSEIVLQLFSPEGQLIWRRNYGDFSLWDDAVDVSAVGSHFVVLAQQSNSNTVERYATATHQIFAVDTTGQRLWTYKSPQDLALKRESSMYAEADGSVVVFSFTGEHEPYSNNTKTAVRWDRAYIYKLGPQRQVEWTLEVDGFTLDFVGVSTAFHKVSKASDGSGYLAAGQVWTVTDDWQGDELGWLVKVSPEGEELWQRKLRVVEVDDFIEGHALYDLAEAPDGGYVLAGQVVVLDPPDAPVPPIQRGWLLKVDEHGCLVPGCHLVSTQEAGPGPALSLHLYPNPAQEHLYVLLKDAGIAQRSRAALRLVDVQGRVLQSHPAGRVDEVTSVLPVQQLPAGLYFLQYWADGQVLASERVVVGR